MCYKANIVDYELVGDVDPLVSDVVLLIPLHI